MTDTPESLLREMVGFFGERPYQARDLRGQFDCVFCGGTTEDEKHPKHEPHCVWPRVLQLVGGVKGETPKRWHSLSNYGEQIAALIRVEERLARKRAAAAAKKRKAAKR